VKRIQLFSNANNHVIYVNFTFIYIGTAHCANMYPSASSDLPELTYARTTIKAYLKEWLAENDFVDSV